MNGITHLKTAGLKIVGDIVHIVQMVYLILNLNKYVIVLIQYLTKINLNLIKNQIMFIEFNKKIIALV